MVNGGKTKTGSSIHHLRFTIYQSCSPEVAEFQVRFRHFLAIFELGQVAFENRLVPVKAGCGKNAPTEETTRETVARASNGDRREGESFAGDGRGFESIGSAPVRI